MTNEEVYKALEAGHTRFLAKRSKRVYFVHSDQMEILKPFSQNVLLIGWPEKLSPARSVRGKNRGRKWVWLSPNGMEVAS